MDIKLICIVLLRTFAIYIRVKNKLNIQFLFILICICMRLKGQFRMHHTNAGNFLNYT